MLTVKKNQGQLNRLKPTYIGRTAGYSFYECPVYGDESPMLTKVDGIWMATTIWEIEDASEEIKWAESNSII